MGCRDGRSPAVRAGEREVEAPRTSCMRRTLLALAISVLFLAGCAQTTTHTPVAKAPPSTPEVHVAAVDGIVGVSPDGLSLHLTAPVGAPCSGRLGPATGLVREDTAEVVVLLSVNGLPEAPSHSQPCPAVLPVQAVCVRLNRPLGDRAVIDGATGALLSSASCTEQVPLTDRPAVRRTAVVRAGGGGGAGVGDVGVGS